MLKNVKGKTVFTENRFNTDIDGGEDPTSCYILYELYAYCDWSIIIGSKINSQIIRSLPSVHRTETYDGWSIYNSLTYKGSGLTGKICP